MPSVKNILLAVGKPIQFAYCVLLSLISGLLSFAFIVFVNFLIHNLLINNNNEKNYKLILIFIILLACFVAFRKIFTSLLIKFSQRVFWYTRTDIASLMLQADYESFIRHKEALHASLVRDANVLAAASVNVVQFSSSVVIILASFVYMVLLSLPLFVCTCVVLLLGILKYSTNMKQNQSHFTRSQELEDAFILSFNSLLYGFKEISLAPDKGKDIMNLEIRTVESKAIISNYNAYVGFLNNQITGQLLFNCLTGIILLGFANWLKLQASTIMSFMFVLLYVLSATESVMVMLPSLVQAKVSLNRLAALKEVLGREQGVIETARIPAPLTDFREIELASIVYTHYEPQGAPSFSVGPVNLKIFKGEIIFIYGGNGSGKTTFILSLLGLLKPTQGAVFCDNRLIQPADYENYRALFSAVFNDFYLFNKLFGIPQIEGELVRYYIELFELGDKVTYDKQAFSTRDLSTGQRKRLALITSLLEQKPILVLDEWAADQDPYFRKKFYTEILPLLKKAGFTIVAITHDDKYYNCADRIFEMDYGKLRQVWLESFT
ncbi:MAG: cyclic peptide export ABC transporter [Janthinobacterium lividum]